MDNGSISDLPAYGDPFCENQSGPSLKAYTCALAMAAGWAIAFVLVRWPILALFHDMSDIGKVAVLLIPTYLLIVVAFLAAAGGIMGCWLLWEYARGIDSHARFIEETGLQVQTMERDLRGIGII
jgi:hypothetical protein